MFAGTTNQTEYLRDNTGNLRFMPVWVRQLTVDRLLADRDQLWAEAVHRYKAGELWYPQSSDFTLMARYQSIREIIDPREDKIASFLTHQASNWSGDGDMLPVTTSRLLHEVLGVPESADNLRYKAIEVGRLMRKLGWKPQQFSTAAHRHEYGRNYYVATEAWAKRDGDGDADE